MLLYKILFSQRHIDIEVVNIQQLRHCEHQWMPYILTWHCFFQKLVMFSFLSKCLKSIWYCGRWCVCIIIRRYFFIDITITMSPQIIIAIFKTIGGGGGQKGCFSLKSTLCPISTGCCLTFDELPIFIIFDVVRVTITEAVTQPVCSIHMSNLKT